MVYLHKAFTMNKACRKLLWVRVMNEYEGLEDYITVDIINIEYLSYTKFIF